MSKTIGITAQIAKYQTNKGLVELLDNLNVANIDSYAKIHSKGGDNEYPSKIKMKMLDYSKGTGASTVEVNYNLEPWEIKLIFNMVKRYIYTKEDFSYSPAQKINSHAIDANGYSKVSKVRIDRQYIYNNVEKKFPWMITMENGVGKSQKSETGGTYVAPGTYKQENVARIMLNDADMYALFCNANTFVNQWENAHGPKLIRDGKAKLVEVIKEAIRKKNAEINQ